MQEFTASDTWGVKNYKDTGPPTRVAGQSDPGKGKPRCKACKFHVRGPNHEQGEHHIRRATV